MKHSGRKRPRKEQYKAALDLHQDHLFPASSDQIAENLVSLWGFSESELYEENCSGQRDLLQSKIAALDTMINALQEIENIHSSRSGTVRSSSPTDSGENFTSNVTLREVLT